MSNFENSKSSKLKLTYSDYVDFPDDGNRHEIIDGDHYVTPAPESYHQTLVTRLTAHLYRLVEEAGLGRVLASPLDVLLSQADIVQPDLVAFLNKNQARITRKNIQGGPDLIIEVLSASTASRDRALKKNLYARSGVPEYWIVDTEARVIEQHTLLEGRYVLAGKHKDRIECHSIPGVVVDLARVW